MRFWLKTALLLAVALMFNVAFTPPAHACLPAAIPDPHGGVMLADFVAGENDWMDSQGSDLVIIRRQTVAESTPAWNYYRGGVRANTLAWGPGAARAESYIRGHGSHSGKIYRSGDGCAPRRGIDPIGEPMYFVSASQPTVRLQGATDEVLTEVFGPPTEIPIDAERVASIRAKVSAPRYARMTLFGSYGIASAVAASIYAAVRIRRRSPNGGQAAGGTDAA